MTKVLIGFRQRSDDVARINDGLYSSDPSRYKILHRRVSEQRGRPSCCEACGTTDPNRCYDWANITGNYEDPSDYKRMCRKCHNAFDLTPEKVAHYRTMGAHGRKARSIIAKTRTHCKNGHPLTFATGRPRSDGGGKRCRICQREATRAYRRRRAAGLRHE